MDNKDNKTAEQDAKKKENVSCLSNRAELNA